MGINLFQNIGILGAGAWGTALALTIHRAGRDVRLWAREPEVVRSIESRRENSLFLPDVQVAPAIQVTADAASLMSCDVIVVVTPAQHTRALLLNLAHVWPQNLPVVIACKGIEIVTGKLMSEVVAEVLPGRPVAVLSGPTFAIETAKDKPTALTLASAIPGLTVAVLRAFGHRTFRPYASDDVTGVEIGGALKNVIAIACGFVSGLGLGDNSRAAIITRGLAEITRYAVANGAQVETLMGLSCMGDLVLTCSSMTSRNFSLGRAIGEGQKLSAILVCRASIAEGVSTAEAVARVAHKRGIDMPITGAVHHVLSDALTVHEALDQLLNRPFRFEADISPV